MPSRSRPCSHPSTWRPVLGRLRAVLALAALAACSEANTVETAPPTISVPAEIEVVRPEVVAPSIRVTGLTQPRSRVQIPFQVSGLVARVLVDEADAVEVDQVLAELETPDLKRELRSARAALARATARATAAARSFERQKRLFATETTSLEQYEDARSAHEVAAAELELARVATDDARERLGKTVLRSPVRGFVERRMLEPHEWANAQTPVLVLVEMDTVLVRANIPSYLAGRIEVGGKGTIHTATDGVFAGQIVRVSVSADRQSRTVPFEVEVANPELALRAESVVEVEVPIGEKEERSSIPLSAVLRDSATTPFCFVAVPSPDGNLVASRRPLELGAFDDDRVVVESGLAPGERLIVRGQHFMSEGDRIHVVKGELQ